MPLKKPLGVTIFASLLTVIGGFTSVVIFIELIDSIRFFGAASIGISSIISFFGFIIFAITPVLLYASGVGLFLSQPWAWKAVVYFLPVLLFFFFANLAYGVAWERSVLLDPSPVEVIFENTDVFVNVFFRYAVLVLPVIYYFTRPVVVLYFEQFLPKAPDLKK